MSTTGDEQLAELVRQVQSSQKYSSICTKLIREIGKAELEKRRSIKEAVKFTRSKLHQVGSAYQEKGIPYKQMRTELELLPNDLQAPESRAFCEKYLKAHASSQERITSITSIFQETLKVISPVHSVIDLACGLNPLAIPWMPLDNSFTYLACDIYEDMIGFLSEFFIHFKIQGKAQVCDLVRQIPEEEADVAFVLKTIPCLEQLDKSAGYRILQNLKAKNILVSFPAHSLGGRSKGMVQNYEDHFNQLTEGQPWKIQRMLFPGELTFLIQK